MTDKKGTAAYDLSLFEQKRPSVVALEPNKKVQEEMKRRTRRQNIGRAVSAVLVASVVLSVVVMMIVSRVRLTEMNEQADVLSDQLEILQSENVRLSGDLSALASAESIDAYVQEHGMQKVESHQIEYFTMEESDRVEVPADADETFWETLWNTIASWFC